MTTLVGYELDGPVATLRMDDGKVNVLSPAMQAALHAGLDRAEADGAVVVLAGREGVFSAGFDLKILRAGGPAAIGMLRGGFELADRILRFPAPVVMACTGHAIAMGTFLLLAGDYRVGAAGPFKVHVNEAAIGLTLPYAAIALLEHRLAPPYLNRVAVLAEPFAPAAAVTAGLLDATAEPADVLPRARAVAVALSGLDLAAHTATKLRLRAELIASMPAKIAADYGELVP